MSKNPQESYDAQPDRPRGTWSQGVTRDSLLVGARESPEMLRAARAWVDTTYRAVLCQYVKARYGDALHGYRSPEHAVADFISKVICGPQSRFFENVRTRDEMGAESTDESSLTKSDLLQRPDGSDSNVPCDSVSITGGDKEDETPVSQDKRPQHFRKYLRKAIDNFVRDLRRKDEAQKRRPEGGVQELDAGESYGDRVPDRGQPTPDQELSNEQGRQMLDEVIAAVEAGCRSDRLETHWKLFRRRVLGPLLYGEDRPSLEELRDQLAISDRQPTNMITVVKRRFGATFRQRMRHHMRGESILARQEMEEQDPIAFFLGQFCA